MPGLSSPTFARIQVDGNWMCFKRIQDKTNISLMDNNDEVSCGKFYHTKEKVDEGIVVPKLHFLFQPSPEELDIILPWIGFTETTDVFALDGAVSSAPVILDRVATVDDLGNAYVDKAIFRGQKGRSPLSVELICICDQVPDIDGGTWSASAPTHTAAYPFHRAVLTAEGSAREFSSFVYVIDNHLAVNHNGNRVPTAFEIGGPGQTHHLGIDTPYTSSETVLLTNPIASVAGAAGSIVFTRGGQSTTFAFHNMKTEANPPDVAKPEEIRLKTFYRIYGSGSTHPVQITHDPVA